MTGACETRGICRMLRTLDDFGGRHYTLARVAKDISPAPQA